MGIFLLWATWTNEYMTIFVKIYMHHTLGVLKELEVSDFDNTWSTR